MAKPIFVMKLRSSTDDSQMEIIRESMCSHNEMHNDYYMLITRNHIDEDKFEMYNSDKIEVEAWDELVDTILNKNG